MTKNKCIKFYGIFEGEKYIDDVWHANLKYKFGNRHFWSEGYYASTVGLNEATIKKYIAKQEKHDIAMNKLSVKEDEAHFRGGLDFMPIIGFVYDVLLILLLILKITKLNKENRIGELKRINYLSVIVGHCLYCLLLSFPFSRYYLILWSLLIIALLISAITNGILIFKRKKSNKKY